MNIPVKLRPKQLEAKQYIDSDAFDKILVTMPTGAGKTLMAMMAMDKVIKNGNRVAWLSPMKTLTSEQTETFSKEWRVKEITGDTERFVFDKNSLEIYDVFVFTPEKFYNELKKERARDLFFDDLEVNLVVVDEVHMIGDPERGPTLKKFLMILMTLYPFVHVIGLSATIGNVNEVANFLHAKSIHSDERPVPLVLDFRSIPTIRRSKDRFEHKMRLLREIRDDNPGEKTILFWSSRARSSEAVIELGGYQGTRIYGRELVKKLMEKGVAFHNASLDATTRKLVEKNFREGKIDIVSSTTTFAVGVNTPARRVVIGDVTRYNWWKSAEELLKPSEFHQMLGRAGRPGFEDVGYGTVLCDQHYSDIVQAILEGTFYVSCSMKTEIESHVLDFIVSYVDSVDALHEIFKVDTLDPMPMQKVDDALEWLLDKKFLRMIDGTVEATFFGRMTSFATILPRTALHLVSVNDEIDPAMKHEPQFMELFDKMFNTEEFLKNMVVRSDSNDKFAVQIAKKFYNFTDDRVAKAFSFLFFEYLDKNRMLTKEEQKMFTGNETFLLRELCNRFVHASQMLCSKNVRVYKILESMISTGYFDVDMAGLHGIRGIGPARLEKLFKAGIRSVSEFMNKPIDQLSKILGLKVESVEKIKGGTR